MNNLFVYGLLKRDGSLVSISRALGEFKAEVRSQSPFYDLFSLGYAPGIVGGNHYLLGELWEMIPEAFEYLDFLEGGYQRREIEYRLAGDKFDWLPGDTSQKAWIYFYRTPTEGHTIRDPHIILNEATNTIKWDNTI